MNPNSIYTTIMTLLVSAYAFGCGPVDGEDWDYESQQAAFITESDENTLLDQHEYALTARTVDRSEAPVAGDIRQWEGIAKWESARLQEEEKTDEIDDSWAEHEIRRMEAQPEVQGHREAAEDVVLIDIDLIEGVYAEDEEGHE